MITVIKPGNGIYAPVLACDYCGQPINNGQGNFLWNPDIEGDITEVYFSHKECDKSLKHQLAERGIHTMWMDLDMFFLHLVSNTKIDLKKAKEMNKLLRDQGLEI